MRDIQRDVTNLSNQQREVSTHSSLNVPTPRRNGPFNCSRSTEFHQPPHFDELHACLDTLKKFHDHKLGIESHYMMVMNMEDLNGWTEKEEDATGECVEGEENGEDDEHVDLTL
ncbi:hypothetical protein M9H77_34400 [Catharanthus roseus]|uniref:Uncharacterized protein n=1 Tax=Catharanthus roseus TaxID=4058 RepID=A0ACB9ZLB6_CATRO|nr:hypothetical protein M9H77_34400 [Catharanthus roseus]